MNNIKYLYCDSLGKKIWESFSKYFKNEKGFDEWKDETIAATMNKDDIKMYCDYVKETLENYSEIIKEEEIWN